MEKNIPREIYVFPDSFNNDICVTQPEFESCNGEGTITKCSKIVKYYVRSIPNCFGIPGIFGNSDLLIQQFQECADEWKKYTNITFKRIFNKTEADFMIRSANSNEEDEKPHAVARSFFWSTGNDDIKTLVLWKKIKNWNHKSIFLHEIGHILGFKHEHAFLTKENRKKFDNKELINLADKEHDTNSIMSNQYMHRQQNNGKQAILSDVDIEQAKSYYSDYF